MVWNKYTIKTVSEAEESISGILAELGIYSIEIEDNVPLSKADQEKLFIDILPKLNEKDNTAFVSFYLEEDENEEVLLSRLRASIQELARHMDIGAGSISSSQTKDEDWINNWKQFFQSFAVDDILIKPTWEEGTDKTTYPYTLLIDPGTSFGTGKHETTQLCIRQLRKYVKPQDRVLDVGCGSGILSVICLKLSASHVTGIDVDPECVRATYENMRVNGLSEEQGEFFQGNLIEDAALRKRIGERRFDIVVANILADIIIPLTPHITGCLKPGGYYITSGIIDFKEKEVSEALRKAGLILVETMHQGEWVSITARKP